jgi:ABC-type uncharacterized transport system auxiliary subunit
MTRLAPALLLMLLSACAALKGGDAPVTMRLSPRFAPAAPSLAAPSFVVAPVQARGLIGGQRYAYVDAAAPGEIRQAATFFWEEPPADAVGRALVAGLRSRFASVSGPGLPLTADRRVVAVLDRFEEVSAAGSARALVAFDATQVMAGKAVTSGRYCGSAPIAGAAGSVRAAAFQTAIEQAVAAFVQDAASGRVTAAAC